jgi:uncharacterized protein
MDSKSIIYTIPAGEKYLIYAPLTPLAFMANMALINKIAGRSESNESATGNGDDNEIIGALQNLGLFDPDRTSFLTCDCNAPFLPSLCILMPTTACNLACKYCYAARENSKTVNLPWPIAKKAIDVAFNNARLKKRGKFSLSFHGGGEPTLDRQLFFEASGYARSLDPGCPISVTTNAVWDKDFRDRALAFLTEISISFDGSAITQNRQRPDKQGHDTFSRVMDTIHEIDRRQIRYGIRMTVTKESLHELYDNVVFLFENTACKSIQVEPVYNQGRAFGAGITLDDVDAFSGEFMKAHDYARSKKVVLYYSGARPHLNTITFCKATSEALIVTADSELTACFEVFDRSHDLAGDFMIGRLDPDHGIVLYPGKREALLKKIGENRDICEGCFCYYHCAGDCPPKAFMAKKSNDQFRCSVTRSLTREMILDRIAEAGGIWQGK